MALDLDNIPRAIKLERADASDLPIPEGFPILELLDQTKLPDDVEYLRITDWREVIDSIKRLCVRGAPAIGVAGAAAMVLRAAEFVFASNDHPRCDELDFERVFVIDEDAFDPDLYLAGMKQAADMVASARPTAVNLKWAVDRCMQIVEEEVKGGSSPSVIADVLFEAVEQMMVDDENANRSIGNAGAALLPADASVLTHCNAGSLATAFYGTALGIVYSAASDRGIRMVYSDETRPVCQGSRLTVWELSRAGVPVTLICDDMAASVISQGKVDAVIVGADRIAANGDTANKIGTLGLAIIAHQYGVPFIVAAPTSTIDRSIADGSGIVIEQRDPIEVLKVPIDGVEVYNPAFDVTPARLIDWIVTEEGAFKPDDI